MAKEETKNKRILVTLDTEYYEKLKPYAEKEHASSITGFISRIVMQYVDDKENGSDVSARDVHSVSDQPQQDKKIYVEVHIHNDKN